jgi:hypothetical protein
MNPVSELKAGTVLHGGRPGETPHYYILLSDQNREGCVVMVNVTTKTLNAECRRGSPKDAPCVREQGEMHRCAIEPGDCSFLNLRSWVAYETATLVKAGIVQSCGFFERRPSVSDRFLQKLRSGLLKCQHVPRNVREEVQRAGEKQ